MPNEFSVVQAREQIPDDAVIDLIDSELAAPKLVALRAVSKAVDAARRAPTRCAAQSGPVSADVRAL